MPYYMTQFSYTSDAVAALAKDPQDRSVGLAKAIEALGGRLVAFYYCLGEFDGVAICEMPDSVAELSVVLAAVAPGHVGAIRTTALLTVEEAMAAMKTAGAMVYKAPGE